MAATSAKPACLVAWALAAAWVLGGAGAKGERPSREQVLNAAVRAGESLWREIAAKPAPEASIRGVFAYASTLCQARRHPERLERLFELAAAAQDRQSASRGYGNFRWYLGDTEVTDENAVEFCLQDAVDIWHGHRAWLSEVARRQLGEILGHGVEACLRHHVREDYTNIAVLNAGNLIALGELLDRTDVAAQGYQRLDAVGFRTWEHGLAEYCSPTYYGVDLDGLAFIETYARRSSGRQVARALAELLWTDVSLNWFAAAQRSAGAQSRCYDYRRATGELDRHLWLRGWRSEDEVPSSLAMLRTRATGFAPPARLLEQGQERLPRLVRQAWEPDPGESRTHQLYSDVTLSCSGAHFGPQDFPLTVDLPGERSAARCYFVPDGRDDPYGIQIDESGGGRQRKVSHLTPFWAAAQRSRDAVGLVVYRQADSPSDAEFRAQSHFVLRGDVDGWRLRGVPVTPPGATAGGPGRVEVGAGDPLILREGTAALVDDGNALGLLRLTVEHRATEFTMPAGAAFWVRIGSGLRGEREFDDWARHFESAAAETTTSAEGRIRVAVPGIDGEVAVEADTTAEPGGRVLLMPAPSRGVLELDGQEIGRPLLESIAPVAAYLEQTRRTPPIAVPAAGDVTWEAEQGVLVPPMLIGRDADAVMGRYVWQKDDATAHRGAGRVEYSLDVARAGRYFLWARVLAPDPRRDSLHVRWIRDNEEATAPFVWHTGRDAEWQWRPVASGCPGPMPVDLPAGLVRLELHSREPGVKVDRLLLTEHVDVSPGG